MPLRFTGLLILCAIVLVYPRPLSADFNPAVLWPTGGDLTEDPFALQVYNGVTSFEVFLKAPVRKYQGPDKKRTASDILKEAADQGSNPIFTFGYAYAEALLEVVPTYPHIHFVAVDGSVYAEPPDNFSILEFANEEGAYLMGILAAFTSKTDKVGFVGGMDVEAIRKFGCGYIQGALSIKPNIEVIVNMVSTNALGFNNQARAQLLAKQQYEKGVDIIFHAAGASGLGVFEAAKKAKKYAIGVDSNQNAIAPGLIISSLLKRIDIITYNFLKRAMQNQQIEKWVEVGIRQDAFDWVIDENNLDFISLSVKNAIDKAMVDIATGAIEVNNLPNTPECPAQWM